jgi:hypothetical protein
VTGLFSWKSSGVTISETAAVATPATTAQRLFAETSGSALVGVAVANPSAQPAAATFELSDTDFPAAVLFRGSTTIPAGGQVALLLKEIPGLRTLSDSFRGVVRVSTASASGLSVIGLKSRVNERGELITSTLPSFRENSVTLSPSYVFPHFVDGGGYVSNFVLFGNATAQSSAGVLEFLDQAGRPLRLGLK